MPGIEIDEHAVDRFIQRVRGDKLFQYSEYERCEIKQKLLQVVYSPEVVYQRTDDDVPIHIKGDIAIPVDKNNGIVASAYHSSTYKKKIDE